MTPTYRKPKIVTVLTWLASQHKFYWLIVIPLVTIAISGCILTTSHNVKEQTSQYASTDMWLPYDGMSPNVAVKNDYFYAAFMPVTASKSVGAIQIAGDNVASTIYYSKQDAKVVEITANALRDDIERVTDIIPKVSSATPVGDTAIIIGTIGQSELIDKLVSTGKIEVSAISGKWEAYSAKVVTNPLPGLKKALVIAGSDRRGTAFGAFALSESMGVSPWYFWGDVPVKKKSSLYIAGSYVQPSPGVKYRGIFLNDEDWGLLPWAAKNFEPEVGNIGSKTYATIFELLLRLQANMIWPAMHEFPRETTPFYLIPENKVVADNYAIVISTSHHEPMLRNSHEFKDKEHGAYNYWSNRDTIYNFWQERVKETAEYENIYTMGLRGRSDVGMLAPEGTTNEGKAAKIQQDIIPDQRTMIAEHVHKNPSEIPQIFIPYKETLVQYQSGLELPDDVTIVWPDDNHGYIRQLSNTVERKRTGGSGVYYHLSYWGVPASYLWLNSTPPGMTYAEMSKAWHFEANKIWIVNVGDIKPHEIGMEFFLRLARNPEAFSEFEQTTYFKQWAARTFDEKFADDIADVLDEYFRLNIVKRPEHMHTSGSDTFSLVSSGDESRLRLDDFSAMTKAANNIYAQLNDQQKAAFYEMVLYPIRSSYFINRKELLAERSRLWAKQKRSETQKIAEQATIAHQRLLTETKFYNEENANGKWQHMLSPMPIEDLPRWGAETQNPWRVPQLGRYSPQSAAKLGVAIEGLAMPIKEQGSTALPLFNKAAESSYFIDVFNQGSEALIWQANVSNPWVILSQSEGTSDARIIVSIDWEKLPLKPELVANIRIESAGSSRTIKVNVVNPQHLLIDIPKAVEHNNLVRFDAEDFFATQDNKNGIGWRKMAHATASGDGMTIQPVTAASIDFTMLQATSPSLSYKFYTTSTGKVKINTQALPTHRITSDHPGVRYAISLNGDKPQIVDIYAKEYSSAWNDNTKRAAAIGVSKHEITKAGIQTMQIWMVDAGVVLDNFTVALNAIATGVWLEAECGELGTLWTVPNDSKAANSRAVTVKKGNNSGQSPPNKKGQIVLNFDAENSGEYDLWGRVKAPSNNDDSFWLKVNNNHWFSRNNLAGGNEWLWHKFTSARLNIGSNVLTIGYREDGAQLDKIFIGSGVPEEQGQLAVNSCQL